MEVAIRPLEEQDIDQALAIWNDVIDQGTEFPQRERLTRETGRAFFAGQTRTAVAKKDGEILGLYILHPNNVGRCGHICNASFAVRRAARGMHVGEALVCDCLARAGSFGYRILQFNAVVEQNTAAMKLYEKLGFVRLGTIPGGFQLNDGSFADISVFYHKLT